MSERRKQGAANRTLAYIAAALVHAVIIVAAVFKFTGDEPEIIQSFDAEKIDIVKARAVDESAVSKQVEKLKKKELDKKRKEDAEKKRLKELQEKSKREKKRLDELERQKRKEELATAEAKKKRIAIEKKRKEEEKKEAERLKKKKKREKQRAAEKAKRDAEIKRLKDEQEELERLQREREQSAFQKQLQDEENRRRAAAVERAAQERTTTIKDKYGSLIEAAIQAQLRAEPGTEPWRKTKVRIKLSSQGEVLSVSVVESSGLPSFDRSAERAVLQASPLPLPSEAEDKAAAEQLRDISITIEP